MSHFSILLEITVCPYSLQSRISHKGPEKNETPYHKIFGILNSLSHILWSISGLLATRSSRTETAQCQWKSNDYSRAKPANKRRTQSERVQPRPLACHTDNAQRGYSQLKCLTANISIIPKTPVYKFDCDQLFTNLSIKNVMTCQYCGFK